MKDKEILPKLLTLRALLCAAAEEKARLIRYEKLRNRKGTRLCGTIGLSPKRETAADRNVADRWERERTERKNYENFRHASDAYLWKAVIRLFLVLSALAAIVILVRTLGDRSASFHSGEEYALWIAIVAVASLAGATAAGYTAYCVFVTVAKKRKMLKNLIKISDGLEEKGQMEKMRSKTVKARLSDRLGDTKKGDSVREENVKVILAMAKRRFPEFPPERWHELDWIAYRLRTHNTSNSESSQFRAEIIIKSKENGKILAGSEKISIKNEIISTKKDKIPPESGELFKIFVEAAQFRFETPACRKELADAQTVLAARGITVNLRDAFFKHSAERTEEILGALDRQVGTEHATAARGSAEKIVSEKESK